MGLFGSSALKRKIVGLTESLETTQQKLANLEAQCSKLESSLSSKDESFRVAKEGRQKAEKKLEKLAAKSMSGDKRLTDATTELARVKKELVEYRDEVLSARAQSDRLQAKLARHSTAPAAVAPEPSREPESHTESHTEQVQAPPRELTPEQAERKIDRRLVRLQEQLDNERSRGDDLKGRALRAEQSIRDADKRRASNAGKLDAKLREVEHALQSERKAYKILQLQYQGLLEGVRGQQQLAAPVKSATPESDAEATDPGTNDVVESEVVITEAATEEAATEEAATEEAATEEAATEEAATEEAATEEAATEEPATEEPATEEPATEEAATEEAATEEAATEEAATEEAATEEKSE
jgi:chromosome segregation ATPase